MSTPVVYLFDEDNYFYRAKCCQKSPSRPGTFLYPERSTLVAPDLDGKHFAKWDESKKTWIYEKIPQGIEDFVGVSVSHYSQTERNKLLRSLIQEFAESSDVYRICRGSEEEGLVWKIEPIPEKTELEVKQERISQLKGNLASTDYVVMKISEGVSTPEDYAQVLKDRQSWREEINRLEVEVEALR